MVLILVITCTRIKTMYSVTEQFAFVPGQMTVATSDLLMFHFNVDPANTVQWVGSKWG